MPNEDVREIRDRYAMAALTGLVANHINTEYTSEGLVDEAFAMAGLAMERRDGNAPLCEREEKED